jgi:hypothetical protein
MTEVESGEATKNAPYPRGLVTLVDYARGLSRR